MCDFCKTEEETIYHLFYECRIIRGFWTQMEKFWTKKTKYTINITKKDVILGNENFPEILNFII